MPKLDSRGVVAAIQIVLYSPAFILSAVLQHRYGLRRDVGWLFLMLFSIARVAGSAVLIAAEQTRTSTALFVAAYTLEYAALALLLLSTLGFIGMAGLRKYSELSFFSINVRLVGLGAIVALALNVAGDILGSPSDLKKASTAMALRRAGAGFYAAVYIATFFMILWCLAFRWEMRSYRRHLLFGITSALPFLAVRVAYAVIAAWSSSDLFGTEPSSNHALAILNPITGKLIAYIFMSVVMEYVTVLLYLFSSTVLSQRHP